MTRSNGAADHTHAPDSKIVFLIGEEQPERLGQLLGSYLRRADVERVVLLTASPALAARVAAPYAAAREEGRLATVLIWEDMESAIRAARRGWGDPSVMIGTPVERASQHLSMAAD